ncbi:MAG: translation initiation factor [Bacteroidales bacterium]|nr:translation initiation factor [Bacteroidales bacterium]
MKNQGNREPGSAWKSRLGVVYSTNPDYQYDTPGEAGPETLPPQQQRLVISLDRKQRKGKEVTLIRGFVGSEDDLKELAKELKTRFGVGGAAKDGEIIIQGDFREKACFFLKNTGYKVKES